MKNIVKLNLLFVFILSIILVICTFNVACNNGLLYILTILTLLMLDFRLLINYKMKDKILKDKEFNYLLMISNLISIFIVLRSFFDNKIPDLKYLVYSESEFKINTLFIEYNLGFIILLFLPLLIYNFTNSKKVNHK